MNSSYSISFIGYGNLAHQLSLALQRGGHRISYIYGQNATKGAKLADLLNRQQLEFNSIESNLPPSLPTSPTLFTQELATLLSSDIIVIAVVDSAIEEMAKRLSLLIEADMEPPTVMHCSGSTPIEKLAPLPKVGVFYPLMTFSKGREVNFSILPFLLEGGNSKTEQLLIELCTSLGSEYKFLESPQRAKMHLAALFVNNFGNHLLALAFSIAKPNAPFLMPLAIETVRKAFLYGDVTKAQTGPAVRGDREVIEKQIDFLLEHYPHLVEFYKLFTNSIENLQKSKS